MYDILIKQSTKIALSEKRDPTLLDDKKFSLWHELRA